MVTILFMPATVSSAEYSGPVATPRDLESPAIQGAPAYDTEAARAYIDIIPEIRGLVDGIVEEGGLAVFGEAAPSLEALEHLLTEIQRLQEGGHKVSLIMADLATKSGVSFQSGLWMCSQSTIKGIYVGSLLEANPASLEENGQYMHDAIVYSDNYSYETLREIYGDEPIRRWCEEAGVDPGFAGEFYPRSNTARDMFKMWTRLYCYLNGDAQYSDFASWFADSIASATKAQLGNRCPVQTKAGWEHGLDESQDYDPFSEIPMEYIDGDPLNDECAINDSGVVYTAKGPYIFVIYTDLPFGVFRDCMTENPLPDLVEALYAVQQSIV